MAVDVKNRIDVNERSSFTTENHSSSPMRYVANRCNLVDGTVRDDLAYYSHTLDGAKQPLRIVLDRRGRISLDAKIWNQDAPTLHIHGLEDINTSPDVESITITNLNEKKGLNDLLDLLGDRGIQELLIEGGAQIWNSFLKAGLVDRLIHIRSENEIGEGPVMVLNQADLDLNNLVLYSESEDTGDSIQIYTKSNFKPPNSAWPYRRVEIKPPGRGGWAIGVVWISSGASDARTRVRILYRPLSTWLQA